MINFGIIYGISAFGLSENLEIPREQAQEYIDAYLARFPHVQDFIARTIEEASRDGYVTSLLGRRRPVPEIRAQNRQTRSLGERLAVNFVMQGSNADIIKVAMIRIHGRLRDEGRTARLVLQVHDELLLEAPETEVGRGQGSRPRGDVRRLRARPAARRRRRRGAGLERGEGLTAARRGERAGYARTGCVEPAARPRPRRAASNGEVGRARVRRSLARRPSAQSRMLARSRGRRTTARRCRRSPDLANEAARRAVPR